MSEASVLSDEQTSYVKTPLGASLVGSSVSEQILARFSRLASQKGVGLLEEESRHSSSKRMAAQEQYSPQRGKPYDRIRIQNESIPIIDTVDVLVAGGGTAGAPATYAAATEGAKTLVVEMLPGFGGTGTYGGVHSYWGPGGYSGFVAEHMTKTKEMNRSLCKTYPDKRPDPWMIQPKMAMWLQEIRASGATILWNSFVVATIMDGNQVMGAVIATPYGVVAVKSRVVVDATGDGDVAAFAGAPFIFGSEHNNVPLWYAIRRQAEPGPTYSVFNSTVDVTNIEDYTRCAHVGLRTTGHHEEGQLHDHQPYLAPRESRHILGDVSVTLTDNLTFRQWDDVINIHRSNTDMKGYHASDWFRIGLIPPNLAFEMPYRSLIPRTLENIIVTGKAISASHGCFSALRMQPDMENLGGIAALAAAQAVADQVSVRDLDVKKLQKRLIKMGMLPKNILDRTITKETIRRTK